MFMSCLCHVYVKFMSCSSHVYVMFMSCLCHVYVMFMSCLCHVCDVGSGLSEYSTCFLLLPTLQRYGRPITNHGCT